MGFLSKIFGGKAQDEKTGGMQDYMTLVRVYFQAALASQLGITNLGMLPKDATIKPIPYLSNFSCTFAVAELLFDTTMTVFPCLTIFAMMFKMVCVLPVPGGP